MKQKRGYVSSTDGDYERKRLEVNFWLVLLMSFGLSVIIYALVWPIKSSYLGILLYERGYTQHLAIWFASIVVILTLIKFFKINREFQGIKRIWISDNIRFEHPQSLEVLTFQKNLIRENSLVALRCGRVIAAYIQSNSRKTATEISLDDSSFYASSSESSYAFPRILIWAIPLLGFIGTVVGISQAVNGFNGFLQQSGDVEQIKEGIGTVTSGLAVAFDTTLLALLLSVLVMIPLVLVERYESRLLLAIDIFINDQLLPRFKEENEVIGQGTINQAINQAIKENFPSPKDLIDPAHDYAKQAVANLTEIFQNEFRSIQTVNQNFLTQLNNINQLGLQDRETFTTSLERQQQVNQELLRQINTLVEQLNSNYTELSAELTERVNELILHDRDAFTNSLEKQQSFNQDLLLKVNSFVEQLKINQAELSSGLTDQVKEITHQLNIAANLLENRIKSLENTTDKLSEITQLQNSLDQLIQSLAKVETVEQVILEAMIQIKGLKPSLEKLSKPRIITFAESDELGE